MADNKTLDDLNVATVLADADIGLIRQSVDDKSMTMKIIAEYLAKRYPLEGVFINALINGNMEIVQEGVSFPAIGDGDFSLDMWYYNKVGTMIHTITQDTNVPDETSQHSLKIDCTTADTTIVAADFTLLSQNIEGFNFFPYVTKTAKLSFWVYATKVGTSCISFRNSGNDRSYVVEYTVDVTNTWEKKEIEITFDYSGGTWDFTNGIGLKVSFALAAGSTFQTTADAWQTGEFYATANQVNHCDDVANDFYIAQVKLNENDIDLPFFPSIYSDELARAQRYLPNPPSIQSGNYTILDNDGFDEIIFSGLSADAIVTLPTLADNPGRKIRIYNNDSTYKVNVDGEGAETINAVLNIDLTKENNYIDIEGKILEWKIIGENISCQLRLHTSAGGGTTDTAIEKFTTAIEDYGNIFTHNHGSYGTKGLEITIVKDGKYSFSYSSNHSSGGFFGLSLNSSQLTTAIPTITTADRLCHQGSFASGVPAHVSFSGYFIAGDIIRAHGETGAIGLGINSRCNFEATYIGG